MERFQCPGICKKAMGKTPGKERMKRGPKWSDDGVRTLLMVVRANIEALSGMDDKRLDEECAKRERLVKMVGKSAEVKRQALYEWHWKYAVDGDLGDDEPKKEKVEKVAVNLDAELERVVKLLKTNGSATDGGIRNLLYKDRGENVSKAVIERGLEIGLIKRNKTSSGTEIIELV